MSHPTLVPLLAPAIACALLVSGCGPRGTARPVRPVDDDRVVVVESTPEVRRAAAENPTSWSGPITYHGVEVRFELPSAEESANPIVRRSEYGDRLSCRGLELEYVYGGFRAAGSARFDFEKGSRVFVFRPPTEAAPWRTVGARFTFSWVGNGESPVVREDRRDGSVVWTFRRTTVTLGIDRTITYRHRENEQVFATPVTLDLEADGTLRRTPPTIGRSSG